MLYFNMNPSLQTTETITLQAERDIKLPSLLANKYHLKKGDILKVFDIGGAMLLIPTKLLKNARARKMLNDWIWDRMEREAEDDMKAGRLTGPFKTAEEMIKSLKN